MSALQTSLSPSSYGGRGAPHPPPPGAGAAAGAMTFTLVQVFSTSTRDPLPVPIDSNLPAIELPFGRDFDEIIRNILACADTGAGATCGKSLVFGTFTARFPYTVKCSVVASETGYSPITLSGIVKEDCMNSTCTKLPMAITFRLPFHTIDNKSCMLTVSVGPDVAVNFLLRLPFVKQARATINFEANIVRVSVFRNHQDFRMSYHRPGLTLPACNPGLVAQTETCEQNACIVRELLGLMENFSPDSENLGQVCGYVSALTAAASQPPAQVQASRSSLFSIHRMTGTLDGSVNGRFVPPARPSVQGTANTNDILGLQGLS